MARGEYIFSRKVAGLIIFPNLIRGVVGGQNSRKRPYYNSCWILNGKMALILLSLWSYVKGLVPFKIRHQ